MSQACVIISAYNNAPSLKLALQGYLRQTSNNFRLIIADDGSRKDLLEAITPSDTASRQDGFNVGPRLA